MLCLHDHDHVHIVIRKHKHLTEEMIANLQERSWEALTTAQRRCTDHPVWGGPGWKVFLDTREDVGRTIRYVRDNPVRIGRPMQVYDFVKPYDGWLPGIGAYRKG